MAPHLKSYEAALKYCSKQGLRLSKQRQLILKLLWESDEHLLARTIYDRLHQRGEDIGHTSVYQNLDVLSKIGVVERLETAEGCLYSHQTLCHSHVHCLDDGHIVNVMVTLPPEVIAAVEDLLGLEITEYRVEFFAHHRLQNNSA
ncbi:Fur family transcriptional regulator [Leptolyngbya sp. FACHB-261]|uniref:Fur family transcriptional regulator n=1 Tax=Leptolyngbya sp. FACHB-261 TaxID=2692806 RepID=UPI001682CCE2|nr:Fur family transcriptional regulator [Leptolyngbya sp. FACHB-261]MBD2102833.1 transcriptional repressor [Leptolyngbya sp. FACHB-261]